MENQTKMITCNQCGNEEEAKKVWHFSGYIGSTLNKNIKLCNTCARRQQSMLIYVDRV